jgi:intracellular sulfur oxidation DsrE/DsrF family protein
MQSKDSALARRSFLSHLGVGATILGSVAAATAQPAAEPQASGDKRFQPARHPQDAWFDEVPGKHRLVFDTTSADGANWGITFANNFFTANASGYGLKDSDLAVVIVMRHNATSFAYGETIWAKYGENISKLTSFVDPNTKAAPKVNAYARQLDGLLKRGMHLAVCQMATRRYAGTIATAVGKTADEIYDEITGNLLPNAHMVPAGIVAVSRAQEYGYTLTTAV